MKPIYKARHRKVLYDQGTPDEQTITLPPEVTYLEKYLNKIGWWLHKISPANDDHPPKMIKIAESEDYQRFHKSGFYLSIPQANRLYWIWRGDAKWSFFWGPRTKENKIVELIKH
jgi:hypothetical protein